MILTRLKKVGGTTERTVFVDFWSKRCLQVYVLLEYQKSIVTDADTECDDYSYVGLWRHSSVRSAQRDFMATPGIDVPVQSTTSLAKWQDYLYSKVHRVPSVEDNVGNASDNMSRQSFYSDF